MNLARINMPDVFRGKNKKQIKKIIEENIFNGIKKDIMISYYVYEECMLDIAIRYNSDRKTIKRKINECIEDIEMA